MTTTFYKYQSLGNDFILFDWLDQKKTELLHQEEFVERLCQRNFGVGSDGVLIIQKNNQNITEVLMFNPDGTNGQKCLNGIRCVANYLFSHRGYRNHFELMMHQSIIQCDVQQDEIKLNAGKGKYIKETMIDMADEELKGHIIDIGNPHFVIPKQLSIDWLAQNGSLIENHEQFPDRTNIECISLNEEDTFIEGKKVYNVMIYERGAGITYACGSGAAAVMQMLFHLKEIQKNESVLLEMPGGVLESYLDDDENIIQIGPAKFVFEGLTK